MPSVGPAQICEPENLVVWDASFLRVVLADPHGVGARPVDDDQHVSTGDAGRCKCGQGCHQQPRGKCHPQDGAHGPIITRTRNLGLSASATMDRFAQTNPLPGVGSLLQRSGARARPDGSAPGPVPLRAARHPRHRGRYGGGLREAGVSCEVFPLTHVDLRRPLSGLQSAWRVLRTARSIGASLIHSNNVPSFQPGGYAARLLRVPAVTHVRFPTTPTALRGSCDRASTARSSCRSTCAPTRLA